MYSYRYDVYGVCVCVCVCAVTVAPAVADPEDDSRVIWNGWEKLEHTRCSPYPRRQYPRRKLAPASSGLRHHLEMQGGNDNISFRLLNTTTLEACMAACKSSDCPFVVRVAGAKDGNCRLATRSHSVTTHCHIGGAKKRVRGLQTTVYKRTSTPPLRYSLGMYSKWGPPDDYRDRCISWNIHKIRELQAGEQQIVDICALPAARTH